MTSGDKMNCAEFADDTSSNAIHESLDEVFRLGGEDAGELILARHAEPAPHSGSDPMLSCVGLDQAERLAERLDSLWVEAVFTAPERRAQQTARIVAGALGRPLHVLRDLSDVEFVAAETPSVSSGELVERFIREPRWDVMPGFEASRQFRRRAIQAIERILAINQARRAVVVTHSAVINAYLSMLLTVPADRFFTPEHASVSVVRWCDGFYSLRSLNDDSHLGPHLSIVGPAPTFTRRSSPLTNR